MAKALGIPIEKIEKPECLYYDESGNNKYLHIKEGKLNLSPDEIFVLGGVQAENPISQEDYNAFMGRESTDERKASTNFGRSFKDTLRKGNVSKILNLIETKGWHIHFTAVHTLYYGIVDIPDSIKGIAGEPIFKAEFYLVVRRRFDKMVALLKKYKYPNIKNRDKEEFINGLLEIIDDCIEEDISKGRVYPNLMIMKQFIDKARRQQNLIFIQDEETHTWVKHFIQFYQQQIFNYPNKLLVFDEENQVESMLNNVTYEFKGQILKNFKFVKSNEEAMIQVSDYVVGILRKYFMFLDRHGSEVEKDIEDFSELELENFLKLNRLLRRSSTYNPAFSYLIVPHYLGLKFTKYMDKYGATR
ncbi:MAG: DUF3800 domain-containing protein [Muribaculaceae bacterium]|nr:DUF3800 domain-containing protein [Muribaculaceae bacterium]